MNELVNELVEKANLTEEQAQKAIQVLTEYIQSKLPPMMQGMVGNFLGDNNASNPMDKIGE